VWSLVERAMLASLDAPLIGKLVEMVVACLLVGLLAIGVTARLRMAIVWSLDIGMWIMVGTAMLGAALLTPLAGETVVNRRLKP
jgi:TRAP-type C4-dicarboxylate transport system permease small subunit